DAGRFDPACATCGGSLDWALVDESAVLDPRSAYAASKVAQEHYAAAWARQSPGAAISLRYHNVYGPGMPRDTPYSGVAAMFRSSLERGEAPVVFEDGRQMRDFVHVDDVARANLAAAEAVTSDADGTHRAYNICSGHPVSIADVARHVAQGSAQDSEPQLTGRYRIGDVRHVVASPARACDELGFAAQVRPADGLARFATAPLRA
ncbi:MAG: NAD-dependent epimerase/dehydratase family protein, partial [Dermatophilaceae bacterium]